MLLLCILECHYYYCGSNSLRLSFGCGMRGGKVCDVSVYLGELIECEFDGFCFLLGLSVCLYIAYFVELCFLAIFSLLKVISRASSAISFFCLLGRCHTFQRMKTFD